MFLHSEKQVNWSICSIFSGAGCFFSFSLSLPFHLGNEECLQNTTLFVASDLFRQFFQCQCFSKFILVF